MSRQEVSFREVQQFRQWWLCGLLLLATLPEIVLFSYGMITQLVLGNQWGSKPMSDTEMAMVGPLAIGLSILLLYFFYRVRMVTEVRDDGVSVSFLPFVHQLYRFDDIRQVGVVDYNSLVEYGGWGIRWAPGKGWAFNVSGRGGVRLDLTNGKKRMIGSQLPEDLAQAIRERMER